MLLALLLACQLPAEDGPTCADDGWRPLLPLPAEMESHGVVVWDGAVWVLGGYDFVDGARDEVYSLTPGAPAWAGRAALPAPTEHQGVYRGSEGPLLIGGDLDYGTAFADEVRDVVWAWDGGTWEVLGSLPGPRTLHTWAQRGADLYVVGGTDTFEEGMSFTAEVLHARLDDGRPGAWQPVTPLPEPRGWAAAAVLDDWLVVTAGLSASDPWTIEATTWRAPVADDGSLGAWEPGEDLPRGLNRHALTVWQDQLVLTGGNSADGVRPEVFAAGADLRWSEATPLPSARYAHAATAVGDQLWVSGGFDADITPRDTVWERCGG